jgi:hypothetical protein
MSSKPKKIWRGNHGPEKRSLNTLNLTLDLDSDLESHISDSKKFTRKRARFSANDIRPPISLKDGIRITKKDWVEVLEHINEIPLGWDVPLKSTAFWVDLTDNIDFNTEEKSLIAWIRHEVRIFLFIFLQIFHVYFREQDQCSWSGSSGHAKGDADVRNIFGEELVRARRAELTCNGIKLCTFTDRTLLEGFEGWERNSEEMKNFFGAAGKRR